MPTDSPVTIHLEDYQPTQHVILHIDLTVRLHGTRTMVSSVISIAPRSNVSVPMDLQGEGLELIGIAIGGHSLAHDAFQYTGNTLTLLSPPTKPFVLRIEQSCNPQSNTALSGLYVSNNIFCTQMEAEGFRRFAFMQDRPDVMATYKVRIEAPKSLSVLLSNGNLTETGDVPNNDMHFATWEDPHPKPTYLFALVAGDLASVHESFTTCEGRTVSLGIYVEKGKQDRCAWAMDCLKASMRWDEERFGRAYDLDVFNIVAVSDFNMGAMENKGLNIFNDKYILARPDTATDTDHVNIERIIAHEYFHNWSGNRITCRDWFQLCLKEGLTVFRDQEFTSDLRSRAVKRIEDVKTLRARQFPEDQGPLAHAVRPSSYIEINNFYTPTIYEKGAEICRMLHTMLGADNFRAAMDLYFERHDGEAATVEDFLRCMADASGRDLTQFALWYEQAGTPVVDVVTHYDATLKRYRVELKQHTPATPGQSEKQPLHMPLALALIKADGLDFPLQTIENVALTNGVYEFTTAEASLTFGNIAARPVLSLNRGFSAPIVLRTAATEDDLLFQVAKDSDSFNRWEAAQTIARRLLVQAYHGKTIDVRKFACGLGDTLSDPGLDDAYKALMLQLPGEAEITVALMENVDADRVYITRRNTLCSIAELLTEQLKNVLHSTRDIGTYQPDTASCARRSLRAAALAFLSYGDAATAVSVARNDFDTAMNMTVEASALSGTLAVADGVVDKMLAEFYHRHRHDHLLLDKWFTLKAARARTAADIEELTEHADFSFKTPNRVYALIGGFTGGNLAGFHAADGSGYRLLRDCVITLNAINPQVAARMANSFRSWGQYDEQRKMQSASEMQKILQHDGLSNDVFEIISRTLSA
jgi:aminopeptidase N